MCGVKKHTHDVEHAHFIIIDDTEYESEMGRGNLRVKVREMESRDGGKKYLDKIIYTMYMAELKVHKRQVYLFMLLVLPVVKKICWWDAG